jgi:hypothetical protein
VFFNGTVNKVKQFFSEVATNGAAVPRMIGHGFKQVVRLSPRETTISPKAPVSRRQQQFSHSVTISL